MGFKTYNGNPHPTPPYVGTIKPFPNKIPFKSLTIPQVAGLVPVFPCTSDDCRQGKYQADIIADDTQFPLPVFASYDTNNEYENDKNSFLFELPQNFGGVLEFYLDKLIGSTWVQQAHLNNDDYGKYYPQHSICTDKNWAGYVIDWNAVWADLGSGMYKFRVSYNTVPLVVVAPYCYASPPFCLAEYNCYNADKTTKFEAYYAGGKLGNITKANSCTTSFFDYWEYCCCENIVVPNSSVCQDSTFKALPVESDEISVTITNATNTIPYLITGKYSNDSTGGGYDTNGNYDNATSVFTAPCTGVYCFNGAFYIEMYSDDPNYNVSSAIALNAYIYDTNGILKSKIGLGAVGTTGCEAVPPCTLEINYCESESSCINISLNQGDIVKPIFELYVKASVTYPVYVTINSAEHTNCGYFTCTQSNGTYKQTNCHPIQWYDSIRVNGFFGREEKEYERNQIKYHTGIVNKIRDEAIRKFKWRSFGNTADNPGRGLPFWFHDRFSVYGLMADDLLVSDYNYNNSDYNLKRYCVQADTGYSPDYKGNSRYSNVSLDFKSKKQTLARNRCCGAGATSNTK